MGHHKHWIISTNALGHYVGLAISTAKVCEFMVQSHSCDSMGIITAVTVVSTTADAEVQPYTGLLTALAESIFPLKEGRYKSIGLSEVTHGV